MKIGIVLPDRIGMCGGMRGTLEIANRLARRGHDITLYWLGNCDGSLWDHLSTDCRQQMGVRFNHSLDALIATEWRTARPVADSRIRRKFYWIQHRESIWCGTGAEETLKYPLVPITVSRWLGELMRANGHKEVYTITPGFWHDLFWTVPCELSGDRVLLEGSWVHQWKGARDGWDAIATVEAEKWMLSLEGCPDGADRTFVNVPQQSLRWIYSQCDVMVKPSRIEGFPMPPAEAMACGCVPVVCDVPGVNEYCVDDVNCLKVPVRDPIAMRNAVERLLTDDELRTQLRAGGLETVRAELFDWDKRINDWEAVLSG